MLATFTAVSDHVDKVARVHCVPCDAWVVVELDLPAFVDVVGEFASAHRGCEAQLIDLRDVGLRSA